MLFDVTKNWNKSIALKTVMFRTNYLTVGKTVSEHWSFPNHSSEQFT